MRRAGFESRYRQTGMALISALLLLLVVTIMAVSMFRSFGMQEKIAGNTREKQRALNAAISAQNYAEWFLKSSSTPPSVTCTTTVPAATAQICNAPLNVQNDFSITPWAAGVSFTPFTTNGGNGVQSTVSAVPTAGSIGTYYATPLFYITDLGPYPTISPKGELYQIDALGYGGTPSAQAVVESTYLVSTPGPSDPNI